MTISAITGEMAEWLRQRFAKPSLGNRCQGSSPCLSANLITMNLTFFTSSLTPIPLVLFYLFLDVTPGWLEIIVGVIIIAFNLTRIERIFRMISLLEKSERPDFKELGKKMYNDSDFRDRANNKTITLIGFVLSSFLMLFDSFFGYMVVMFYLSNIMTIAQVEKYIYDKYGKDLENVIESAE